MTLGLRDRALHYFFGYDFFISYRWSDGRTYAARLHEELVSRGLVVFLDSSDYAKGDHWREDGRRALHRSSRLLLVCTPDAHDSNAVLHEVEIFARLQRRILPVDISGSLRSRKSRLSSQISPEVLCFLEPSLDCLTHGPSQQTVDDVVNSFELVRQHVRRLRWLSAVVIILACALIGAIAAGIYAEGKRRDAELRRLVAEAGRADAMLNEPAQWAAGLAMATAAALSARRVGISNPEEVRLALLRSVWLATPYRVLMNDAKNTTPSKVTPVSGRVLTIDQVGAVRLLDPRTGSAAALPLRELGKARLAAISADEQLIATVSATEVRVWGIDGQPTRRLPVEAGSIVNMMFTLDGRRVITASSDGAVLSWATDNEGREVIQPAGTRILSVALSPVAPLLALVDDGPQARIVDLTTHETHTTLKLDPRTSRIISIAFSPRGERVVTAGQDEVVEIWNVETGERTAVSGRLHVGEVTSAAFSPDGSRIVSAGFDGTLRIWTPELGNAVTLFGHSGPVTSASFSSDGTSIVSSSEDGTVRLWDAPRNRHAPFIVVEGQMRAPCGHAVSLEGDRIGTVTSEGVVRISETRRGGILADIRVGESRTGSATLSRDGSLVVIAKNDVPPIVRDARTGADVTELPSFGAGCSVDFSPDGKRVVVAARQAAELRSLDGNVVVSLPNRGRTYGAAFSPDGARVATTGSDGRIRLCDGNGGRCSEIDAHTVYSESICFSGGGQQIVSGGGDRLAKLWDANGKYRLTLAGHPDAVSSAVFSMDGRYIYTVSDQDRTVRIWNSATGTLVGRLDFPEMVTAAVELPDRRLAVTVGQETWIGSIDVVGLLSQACRILRPLRSVLGVSDDTMRDVHEGCEAVASL